MLFPSDGDGLLAVSMWPSLSVSCACSHTKAGGSWISQAGCSNFVCWEDSLFSMFLKVSPDKVLS